MRASPAYNGVSLAPRRELGATQLPAPVQLPRSRSSRCAYPQTISRTNLLSGEFCQVITWESDSARRNSRTSRSRASQPAPKQAETLLDLWRTSWLPLSGAAIFAGLLGLYIVGTVTASMKAPPCACGDNPTPTGRPPALTGDNAEQFDQELNLPEWWMGITSLRRRIAARASGNVLEVAMGSGRNLEYYRWDALTAAATAGAKASDNQQNNLAGGNGALPPGITSFTGLDISADMLDVARRKLVKAVPPMKTSAPIVKASTMPDHTGGQLSFLDDHLRLVNSDAHKALPPPSATTIAQGNKYDTVIQTFGLCSVSDPVAVLANLATVVKPDTGRIILLEHGKGWLGLVNGLLDRNAGRHFEKYGCWWNRDIQALVEEAASKTLDLEVVKIERPNVAQVGTLVWAELKVVQKPERTVNRM